MCKSTELVLFADDDTNLFSNGSNAISLQDYRMGVNNDLSILDELLKINRLTPYIIWI